MKLAVLCLIVCASVVLVSSRPQQCNPGESKQEDCNTCTCTSNGLWACTRKLCISRKTRETTKCVPGSSFKKECNTCFCNEYGTGAACTLKLCHPN